MGWNGLQLYHSATVQTEPTKCMWTGWRKMSSSLHGHSFLFSTISEGPPNGAALAWCEHLSKPGENRLTLDSFSVSLESVSLFCTASGQRPHHAGLIHTTRQVFQQLSEFVRLFLLSLQSNGSKLNHCAIFLIYFLKRFHFTTCQPEAISMGREYLLRQGIGFSQLCRTYSHSSSIETFAG